jgi:hypothetical protein
MSARSHLIDYDNDTVIASNVLAPSTQSFKSCALCHFLTSPNYASTLLALNTNDIIANLGATQVFAMARTPVINKRITTNPLKMSLADGRQATPTHMGDIYIDCLPFPLMGHIIPKLTIGSLFGIRVLINIGCKVTFSNKHLVVVAYNGKVISTGGKHPTTNLWTLSMGTPCTSFHQANMAMTLLAAPDETLTVSPSCRKDIYSQASCHKDIYLQLSCQKDIYLPLWTLSMGTPRTSSHQADMAMTLLATPVETNTQARSPTNTGLLTHTVRQKLHFAHQSLCSPRMSTLLKAICQVYLKGCPNLTATGITKYLNPSPATAKRHMKRPQTGIRSTPCMQQRLSKKLDEGGCNLLLVEPHNHRVNAAEQAIQTF